MPLKLLPAYLGTHSIDEALQSAHGRRLLWLEILVNDELDLTPWQSHEEVRQAYDMACRWYTRYRSLITALAPRTPLPSTTGPVDPRDYRTFVEALRFAGSHH